MTPQDVIWRVLERLHESKEVFAASAAALHPVHHQDLLSALQEVEQLTQTQINLMTRMRRRYQK
jgi:hypothetical protein